MLIKFFYDIIFLYKIKILIMSNDKNNKLDEGLSFSSTPPEHLKSPILSAISSTKTNIDTRLSILSNAYEFLKDIEKKEKWYKFRQDTLEYLFRKYPSMSFSKFKEYFFCNIYNKNILMNAPEVLDVIDLEKISSWSDLVSIVIDSISIDKETFDLLVKEKFDVLTFPNLSSTDTAQWYFFEKLKSFLPETEILFWDMRKIGNYIWYNQFNSDSVWFIDLMWNWLFNTCLFKLFKTSPDPEKIKELNDLFLWIDKDIFIWWSTYSIPFEVPSSFKSISMPKMPINNKDLSLKNWVLLNAMWYLNSAYYSDKVKGSFVLGSHNIAEPMHAWKLTVINNDIENRYNHNWLISYFWEKSELLLYIDSKVKEQSKVDDFLSVSEVELENRYKYFQELYNEKIINLVYWIFYRFLLKNFPEKFSFN